MVYESMEMVYWMRSGVNREQFTTVLTADPYLVMSSFGSYPILTYLDIHQAIFSIFNQSLRLLNQQDGAGNYCRLFGNLSEYFLNKS